MLVAVEISECQIGGSSKKTFYVTYKVGPGSSYGVNNPTVRYADLSPTRRAPTMLQVINGDKTPMQGLLNIFKWVTEVITL